jgi:hypothetical protein
MGKTRQHLVLFNYIAMGHPKTFLERSLTPSVILFIRFNRVSDDTKLHTNQEAAQSLF